MIGTPNLAHEQRRKLLNIVFAELQLTDKVVTPVYNKAFKFIAERVNTLNSEEVTLEPNISGGKAVILETGLNSSDWLPQKDSNRLGLEPRYGLKYNF